MATVIVPLRFADMTAPVPALSTVVGFGSGAPAPGVDISSPNAGFVTRQTTPYLGFPNTATTTGFWTVSTLAVSATAPTATLIIDWYSNTAGSAAWAAQIYAAAPGTDPPIGSLAAQSTVTTACVADRLVRSTMASIAGMVVTVPQVLTIRIARFTPVNFVGDTLGDTAKVRSILFTYSDT